MRISDWSSDVCSSDLRPRILPPVPLARWGRPKPSTRSLGICRALGALFRAGLSQAFRAFRRSRPLFADAPLAPEPTPLLPNPDSSRREPMVKTDVGPRSRRSQAPNPDGSVDEGALAIPGVSALTRTVERVNHNRSEEHTSELQSL